MKQLIIAMVLVLSAGLFQPATAQRRHNKTTAVSIVNKADTGAITAYSDTTSAATAAQDSTLRIQPVVSTHSRTFTFADADDPFSLMAYLGSLGVSGVFISLFCILFLLLFLCAPLIIVALIIYWHVHRKRAEYKLAEKALEKGQPVPDIVMRKKPVDREIIWQKGIKNVAVGVGLIIFGLCLAEFFVAVGAIVVCWGAGQCVIARTSATGQKLKTDDEEKTDDIPEENV